MPLQLDNTMKNIINSAKVEFLENGFEKSSMRKIAKNAGVTTGALYNRFNSKDDLFRAVVSGLANYLIDVNRQWNKISLCDLKSGVPENTWKNVNEYRRKYIDYVFENYDIFLILFQNSSGSSYENFFNELVYFEEQEIVYYFNEMKNLGYNILDISPEDIHVLVVGQSQALFEVIKQKRSKQEMIQGLEIVSNFFNKAWQSIINLY